MSRIEELRKKLAKKGGDAVARSESAKADFIVRLNEILDAEKNARAVSQAYIDQIYAKFSADVPPDPDDWIRENVDNLFASSGRKPEWVYETSWCFDDDGKPLEFLHQFEDSDGVNFYVFKGYKEGVIHGVRGKIRFLKVVAQDHNGIIHLDGEITG